MVKIFGFDFGNLGKSNVKINPELLRKKEQYWLDMVKSDGMNLGKVPLHYRNMELCMTALENNIEATQFLPSNEDISENDIFRDFFKKSCEKYGQDTHLSFLIFKILISFVASKAKASHDYSHIKKGLISKDFVMHCLHRPSIGVDILKHTPPHLHSSKVLEAAASIDVGKTLKYASRNPKVLNKRVLGKIFKTNPNDTIRAIFENSDLLNNPMINKWLKDSILKSFVPDFANQIETETESEKSESKDKKEEVNANNKMDELDARIKEMIANGEIKQGENVYSAELLIEKLPDLASDAEVQLGSILRDSKVAEVYAKLRPELLQTQTLENLRTNNKPLFDKVCKISFDNIKGDAKIFWNRVHYNPEKAGAILDSLSTLPTNISGVSARDLLLNDGWNLAKSLGKTANFESKCSSEQLKDFEAISLKVNSHFASKVSETKIKTQSSTIKVDIPKSGGIKI